jgi:Peptidase C13 family
MRIILVDTIGIWRDALRHFAPWKLQKPQPWISREALLLVAMFYVAISTAINIPFLDAGWEINEYGISTAFAQTGIAAAICCLSGFFHIPSRRLLAYVLAFASLYVIVAMCMFLALQKLYAYYPQLPPWLFYTCWLSIGCVVMAAVFRAGRKAGYVRSLKGGFIATAAFFAMFGLIPASPLLYSYASGDTRGDIWYIARLLWPAQPTAAASSSPDIPTTDWEKILYEQPQLVQTALDTVKPTDATPHLYFIGVAPSARQNVFMRETLASRDIFDKHFKTVGRSVILVNSQEPSSLAPLASTSNLKQLAKGLAPKIDPQKDVVLLFITSHGSQNLIAVDQHPLPLNQIKPDDIKKILDATGAQNRVVIISACYSGSFVDDLKDDYTAILTAARDDRTSFGCSNERDWTFFGNALFNHGFRQTRDLQKAFVLASDLVDKWEKKQSLEPSQPQIFVGLQVKAAWQKLMPTFDTSQSQPLATPETTEVSLH